MKRENRSAWHRNACLAATVVALGIGVGVARPRAAVADCVGDCNMDNQVTIDELTLMVNIALENPGFSVTDCSAGDANSDGQITIDEITLAVNYALENPGFTCTAPPTPTPGGEAVCGNGVVETGEDCDIGGTCIGNAKAGTHCTTDMAAEFCCSTADCSGGDDGGVCESGTKLGAACKADVDCDIEGNTGNKCVRCKVFEGKTADLANCAANCTFEQSFAFNLVPGTTDPDTGTLSPGTSGAEVNGDIIPYLPLPIGNGCQGGSKDSQPCETTADCPGGGVCIPGTQTFLVGKDRGDGRLPVVIKADSVKFPRINVADIACACIRGLAQMSCGGTIFNTDGTTETTSCTPGFGICDNTTGKCSNATTVSCTSSADCEGAAVCAQTNGLPCTLVHGENNTASGFAGCSSAGLTPVDYTFFRDADGPKPPEITFSGSGPAGSVVLLNTTSIGTAVGACSGSDASVYGPDGQFCTSDDPQASRGTPQTVPFTTSMATGQIDNANSTPGAPSGVTIGPFTRTGEPFNCSALSAGEFPGGGLVTSFVALAQPTVGDIVVTSQFYNLNPTP
jgi:hypothetical protein